MPEIRAEDGLRRALDHMGGQHREMHAKAKRTAHEHIAQLPKPSDPVINSVDKSVDKPVP